MRDERHDARHGVHTEHEYDVHEARLADVEDGAQALAIRRLVERPVASRGRGQGAGSPCWGCEVAIEGRLPGLLGFLGCICC